MNKHHVTCADTQAGFVSNDDVVAVIAMTGDVDVIVMTGDVQASVTISYVTAMTGDVGAIGTGMNGIGVIPVVSPIQPGAMPDTLMP